MTIVPMVMNASLSVRYALFALLLGLATTGCAAEELPLWYRAAASGRHGVLLKLAGRGHDLDARDRRGWTALHYAAAHEHPRVVKLLIELGADVNATDSHGYTPLDVVKERNCGLRGTPVCWALREGGAELLALAER